MAIGLNYVDVGTTSWLIVTEHLTLTDERDRHKLKSDWNQCTYYILQAPSFITSTSTSSSIIPSQKATNQVTHSETHNHSIVIVSTYKQHGNKHVNYKDFEKRKNAHDHLVLALVAHWRPQNVHNGLWGTGGGGGGCGGGKLGKFEKVGGGCLRQEAFFHKRAGP